MALLDQEMDCLSRERCGGLKMRLQGLQGPFLWVYSLSVAALLHAAATLFLAHL